MSIAYILGIYPSLTESFIRNEIFELRKRGIKITILAIKKGPTCVSEDIFYDKHILSLAKVYAHLHFILKRPKTYFRNIKTIFSSGKPLIQVGRDIRNLSTSIYFLFCLRKTDCTHMHAHFLSHPTSVAMMMSSISGFRYSCSAHAHDIYTTPIQELKEKLRLALFTVTCTKFNKNFLSNLVEAGKQVHHIYHGIDLTKWPRKKFKAAFFAERELRILSVGRFVEKKGTIDLLKAVLEIKQRGYKVKCTLIGEGPLFEILNNFIIFNHLEKEVSIIGALQSELLQPWYENSDIFVLPCIETANGDKDGLPNVLLEALATGLPVITTSVSAIPELINHELTGLIVPEKDHEKIAESIIRLKNDHALYNQIISNGRKRVEEFDINISIDQLCNAFQTYASS